MFAIVDIHLPGALKLRRTSMSILAAGGSGTTKHLSGVLWGGTWLWAFTEAAGPLDLDMVRLPWVFDILYPLSTVRMVGWESPPAPLEFESQATRRSKS